MTFVLGHCGLFEHWREAIASMNHAETFWGCLCVHTRPHCGRSSGGGDLNRLVWGSDHGFGLSDIVGYRLGMLDLAGLTDTQDVKLSFRSIRSGYQGCDSTLLHTRPASIWSF